MTWLQKIKKRVETNGNRGLRLLNRKVPDWDRKIPKKFDVLDLDNCVLTNIIGQGYFESAAILGILNRGVEHGFDVRVTGNNLYDRREGDELNKFWRRARRERIARKKSKTVPWKRMTKEVIDYGGGNDLGREDERESAGECREGSWVPHKPRSGLG